MVTHSQDLELPTPRYPQSILDYYLEMEPNISKPSIRIAQLIHMQLGCRGDSVSIDI